MAFGSLFLQFTNLDRSVLNFIRVRPGIQKCRISLHGKRGHDSVRRDFTNFDRNVRLTCPFFLDLGWDDAGFRLKANAKTLSDGICVLILGTQVLSSINETHVVINQYHLDLCRNRVPDLCVNPQVQRALYSKR